MPAFSMRQGGAYRMKLTVLMADTMAKMVACTVSLAGSSSGEPIGVEFDVPDNSYARSRGVAKANIHFHANDKEYEVVVEQDEDGTYFMMRFRRGPSSHWVDYDARHTVDEVDALMKRVSRDYTFSTHAGQGGL